MRGGFLTQEQHENRTYNSVGSSRIRGRWLIKHWDEVEPFRYAQPYDFVVYQKAYFKRHMEAYQGIKIFDLCDKDWPERPVVSVLNLVDAMVVHTEIMAKELRLMTDKPIVVIPDRIDLDSVKRLKTDYGDHRAKTVLWYGYSENFETVKPALLDIKKRNLKLVIISDREINISGYDLDYQFIQYNQKTIYQDLAKADFIINPKSTNGRYKYKSNNKTILAWRIGVPVASTMQEFDYLMDANNRAKEAEIRQKEVIANYDVVQSVNQYKELIKGLYEQKTR